MPDSIHETTSRAPIVGHVPTPMPVASAFAGRVPPQAQQVEQSVLGAMLLEREAIPKTIEILPAGSFYSERHNTIYEAVLSLFERGNPVDLITLGDELKRRGKLEDMGGAYYLTELTSTVATAANVEYHARIISEKSILRNLIETMTSVISRAYDPSADAFELMDEAESDIFRISDSQLRRSAISMQEVLKEALTRLESIHGREGGITGVPSGFKRIDQMTGGWQPSDLIIIAARPSMGKTAFALAVARNAAVDLENPTGVAIFSLEMSAGQLAQRLLTSEARVDAQSARTGRLNDDDWPRLARAAGRLSEAPIFIDDTPGLTVLELRAKCRRLKAEHDIGLIVVDYLQLMHGTGMGKNSNREQEIAHISRSLKGLAKELNVPVIALSQLSRAVETRGGDKRPQLSDLRESGCLTGESLVTLADTGQRMPIAELCGTSGFNVWGLNTDTYKLEKHLVTNAFCTGTKPVFRMKTRLGRSIRATGNHKFLTIDGWKRLDEISADDHLALPRKIESGEKASMENEELALLGHLIGDGCTLARHAIQYTTREKDLAELVSKIYISFFGNEISSRIKKERNWFQVYLSSTRKHTHGVRSAVSEWLDEMGVWNLRSHEKRIPQRVFEQENSRIEVFLRHLWSTDGCIRMRGGHSPYPAVYYATSSETLGFDVQTLLLRIGINARIRRVSQKGKGRDQFHVIISGSEDLDRFARRIGTVGRYKTESLAEVKTFLSDRIPNTNRDIIPKSTWRSLVTPAMNTAGFTTREMQSGLGMSYCGSTLYKTNLSRDRAARVAAVIQCDELNRLANSDVYWDQIVSIDPDGAEDVFDLTVPGPQNFVANDIIVHNSIEQDADVVAFIYRAERYGITVDENGNSTEGLAELIIGKQRNGPIGDVSLAFIRQHARFENLTTYYGAGDYLPEGEESNNSGSLPPASGDAAPF